MFGGDVEAGSADMLGMKLCDRRAVSEMGSAKTDSVEVGCRKDGDG